MNKYKYDVTIVIPTKNAGNLLDTVLKSIFTQKTKYSYEVICVDSGSTDNTLNIIGKYDVKLFEIKPYEFGHGKTRNFGASKGSGEYIIFITQDALPANEKWLENFIDAMKIDSEIVGGFGIHYPYEDCNVFDKRDLKLHFQGFGSDNTIYQLEDKERYEREEGYRHLLAFFSDNNSCLKREIWEKYPYRDVDFAEDQIWARQMIELGFKKVYCPFAPVYHSHNYNIGTYFERYYDEYKGLYQLHQYIMIDRWYKIFKAMMHHIKVDSEYVKTLNLSKKEIKYWKSYSRKRNFSRYIAGYLGGHYHSYSPRIKNFLDKHISQQYKQIRGK